VAPHLKQQRRQPSVYTATFGVYGETLTQEALGIHDIY
jgi:hypothetical protein